MLKNNIIHVWQRKGRLLLLLVAFGGTTAPLAAAPAPRKATVKLVAWPLSGKVTSAQGEALPGVTVMVKGTTLGTQTAADGSFSLNVPETSGTLVFSFIGYTTVERPFNGPGTFNVRLADDMKALEEVVVTGYTTQRKKDLTGAVAVVDVQALKSQPAASATEALQGKAAGVNIVNDGSPGSTPQIRIRGYSTINNNDPLYVVDGVPYQGKVSWLNQNDIQSIQVLKDASAASIYGSGPTTGWSSSPPNKARKARPRSPSMLMWAPPPPGQRHFPSF
jgi:TonB-dependent SusC/RagA subfamily outer membrane receptor